MAKILVIADRAGKCRATPRAAQIAAALGYDVDVVAFAYAPLKTLKIDIADEGRVRDRLLQERRDTLQGQLDQLGSEEQKLSLSVVWEKDIVQWVNKRCRNGKYSAVVKGSSGSDYLIQTSSDWQLLRECPVPVLIVGKKRARRGAPVLVTLDLQTTVRSKRTLNKSVLSAGKALAEALGVELKILSVVEIPTLLSDLDLIDPASYVRDAKAEMRPTIEKLAAEFDIPVADFQCRHGPVDRVISSAAARSHAQLVVMGTVARRGVKARLLGNSAEKVLQLLKTDVLAVKP